ncbi:MAG TPA: helix-turn-helix domain-containing protein, partial [Paralcaligenes sp.]
MTDLAKKLPVAEAGIKSIEVGCRLLDALANIRHPINLGELALLSKMSPSKAHRYLVSFQRTKLVQHDAQTHRYALGELALKLGYSAAAQANTFRQLQRVQVALRDKTTHTVLLSVWTDGGPVVMGVEDGLSPVVATMKPGATLPLMSSAAGRVFAASMPWRI